MMVRILSCLGKIEIALRVGLQIEIIGVEHAGDIVVDPKRFDKIRLAVPVVIVGQVINVAFCSASSSKSESCWRGT